MDPRLSIGTPTHQPETTTGLPHSLDAAALFNSIGLAVHPRAHERMDRKLSFEEQSSTHNPSHPRTYN